MLTVFAIAVVTIIVLDTVTIARLSHKYADIYYRLGRPPAVVGTFSKLKFLFIWVGLARFNESELDRFTKAVLWAYFTLHWLAFFLIVVSFYQHHT